MLPMTIQPRAFGACDRAACGCLDSSLLLSYIPCQGGPASVSDCDNHMSQLEDKLRLVVSPSLGIALSPWRHVQYFILFGVKRN